jgi:hypothetical protein
MQHTWGEEKCIKKFLAGKPEGMWPFGVLG